MIEVIKYQNHINEVVEIGNGKIFVNKNDLRDFAWNITKKNGRISSFDKGVVKKTIPLVIVCADENEGLEIRNRIFEVMEKDVLAKKHGKFIIGDYYLRCYVTGSVKGDYSYSKGYMTLKLTVQTDFPEWVKESTTVFNTNAKNASEFLDFLFDFPFDYTNELNSGNVVNTGFMPSEFRITVYGFINNPTLYINGHEYSVNVEVGTGEYLVIDSVSKTIVLTKYNGEKVNCFNLRNRDSYIFEKIPEGDHIVTTSESFSFDITLLEERGEPKWT